MFTTRHQSVNGLISLSIGAISLIALIVCVATSYLNRGDTPMKSGITGFFAALGDLLGIIAAMIGAQERDIYVWVPRTGLLLNILMLVVWVILVFLGL